MRVTDTRLRLPLEPTRTLVIYSDDRKSQRSSSRFNPAQEPTCIATAQGVTTGRLHAGDCGNMSALLRTNEPAPVRLFVRRVSTNVMGTGLLSPAGPTAGPRRGIRKRRSCLYLAYALRSRRVLTLKVSDIQLGSSEAGRATGKRRRGVATGKYRTRGAAAQEPDGTACRCSRVLGWSEAERGGNSKPAECRAKRSPYGGRSMSSSQPALSTSRPVLASHETPLFTRYAVQKCLTSTVTPLLWSSPATPGKNVRYLTAPDWTALGSAAKATALPRRPERANIPWKL